MSKLRNATPEEEREYFATPPARLAKLKAFAEKQRKAGRSDAEIRRLGAIYEAELIEQEQNAPEPAPEGLTRQQIAGLNIERASQGLPAYATNDEEVSEAAQPTKKQIAGVLLEKAHGRSAGPDESDRFAPRGMHPTRLARINLERACRGEPALLPSDED